jgi:hypothetical protein
MTNSINNSLVNMPPVSVAGVKTGVKALKESVMERNGSVKY